MNQPNEVQNGHEYNFHVKKWNAVSEEEAVSTQQAAKLSENGARDTCAAVENAASPRISRWLLSLIRCSKIPSDVIGNASEVELKVEDKTQQMPS
uniref:Uncharacterized protein n=1 Tax=Ditylenchus dipsaci TaxID=166011 RepID=A0A915CYR9_9BILA